MALLFNYIFIQIKKPFREMNFDRGKYNMIQFDMINHVKKETYEWEELTVNS
jgi:hypothetical protein